MEPILFKNKKDVLMKLFVFAFLALFGVSALHAQGHDLDFVKEGKTWNCWTDEGVPHAYSYTIEGDTTNIRTGEWYKKVWLVDEQIYGDTGFHYFGAVRQEGDYVYLLEKNATREYMLYDFGIRQGGILAYPYEEDVFYLRFHSSGDEVVNEITRRVVRFNPYFDSWDDVRVFQVETLIEGIGYTNDPFCIVNGFAHGSHLLVSCLEEGVCIYGDDTPAGISVIPSETKSNKQNSVYDLQGRQLSSEPTIGLYIKDGKVMIKENH